MLPPAVSQLLWRALAIACLVLAAFGVVLPVLPTVPFLLVAAWAGGRGWPRLETWLMAHPRYGASIRLWRERGAVPRRAKWAATLMMTASGVLLWLSPAAFWVRVAAPAVMACVAAWLWLRPEA